MGIGDPAVRKPNSSVQSVPTYVWLYYSKIESSDSKKVRHLKFIYSKKAKIRFNRCYVGKIYGGDFAKICGPEYMNFNPVIKTLFMVILPGHLLQDFLQFLFINLRVRVQ